MFQRFFSIFKNKKPNATEILLDKIDEIFHNSLMIHKRYHCNSAFCEDVEKMKLLLELLEKIDKKEYDKISKKIVKEFIFED